MRKVKLYALLALAAAALQLPASAQLPSGRQWSPPIPGTTVQSQLVAFNGEIGADRWPVVVSKSLVGSGDGRKFYQWHISIYALRRDGYRLRYQSPRNGGPLAHVEQANGAKMWFPIQQAKIVGVASLMYPGVQQVVVASHEMAADCGSATVTVFATKPAGKVGPAATVTNYCDLTAKIGADGASLELSGPYYAANAALCCPTKPNATAVLRYAGGKWTESPDYFKLQ